MTKQKAKDAKTLGLEEEVVDDESDSTPEKIAKENKKAAKAVNKPTGTKKKK